MAHKELWMYRGGLLLRPHYMSTIPSLIKASPRSSAVWGYRFLSKRLTAPPAPSDYSDRCLAPLPRRIASSRHFWRGPLSGLSAHISAPFANHPGRGAFGFTSGSLQGFGGLGKIHNTAGPAAISTALCDRCTMTGDCRTAPWFSHLASSSRFSTPNPGVPQPCTPPAITAYSRSPVAVLSARVTSPKPSEVSWRR
jgi:hypothetical protein